jgi:assimilatory nitrate reductase catalytic subunit
VRRAAKANWRASAAWGAMVARVQHGGGIARGSVFMPIHWSGQTASDARVGAVVNPAVDPVSGEPEFKHTPVRIEPFGVNWYGFILSRRSCRWTARRNWTRIQGRGFVRYELAGASPFADAAAGRAAAGSRRRRRLDRARRPQRRRVPRRPPGRRPHRGLPVRVAAPGPAGARLAGAACSQGGTERRTASACCPAAREQGADPGPTVCSCFGVGRNTICIAIEQQGLKTRPEVTACVKAGGNCGSCVPETRPPTAT